MDLWNSGRPHLYVVLIPLWGALHSFPPATSEYPHIPSTVLSVLLRTAKHFIALLLLTLSPFVLMRVAAVKKKKSLHQFAKTVCDSISAHFWLKKKQKRDGFHRHFCKNFISAHFESWPPLVLVLSEAFFLALSDQREAANGQLPFRRMVLFKHSLQMMF